MDPKRSAGVSPAVAGASRPRFGTVTIRNRGRLPHWELDAGLYFVTFRLADSLPAQVLEEFRSERQSILATAAQLGRELSGDEKKQIARLFSTKIERHLDAGAGSCALARPHIAGLVADALRHFDASRYKLLAWCVMPNHVHVVLRLFPGQELAAVVHSWKSFTAKQVNQVLKRSGALWGREYYDHLIRDRDQLHRIVRYVTNNPIKAGLKNWAWVWGEDAPTTAGETPALPR